jgi:hypothetical protein
VSDVIRTGAARDRLGTNVDLVTVPTLLGHAAVPTTAHDDHPSDGAKQQAAATVQVPSLG